MSRSPKLRIVSSEKKKAASRDEPVRLNANIEARNKGYDFAYDFWKKCRDFIAGGARVKNYIVKLPGHDTAESDNYKARAYFLPAVARTLDSFVGMIMNPEPVIQVPDELKPFLNDVTNDGEPIQRMIARTVSEVISVSRCCVLVDFPRIEDEQKDLSKADAEDAGLRAYATLYNAEDILDWRTDTFGGQRFLSFLKLKEVHTEKIDEWTSKAIPQIRVLDFAPKAGAGENPDDEFYRVRVFRQETGGWAQVGEDHWPEADGELLDEIPAVIFSPNSLEVSDIQKPVLYDMVDISESHYNNSALMEWALLWVGNPTAVFKGLKNVGNEPIRLGSSQGIVTTENGGAEILYLPAEGVGAIDKIMENKRRDMAAVGARLLADETKGQIARDTAVIQRAGEHSVLAGIAGTVSDGWERILKIFAKWEGVDVKDEEDVNDGQGEFISVKLNTDYIPLGLQVGELKDLMDAVNQGKLSSRDLFALLQKRGVIAADKTYDQHLDEVEEDDARIVDNPRSGGIVNPPPDDGTGGNNPLDETQGGNPKGGAAAKKKPAAPPKGKAPPKKP